MDNTVKDKDLCFEIDPVDFIAKLDHSPDAGQEIFIPSSINYQSQEFIVKIILDGCFVNNRTVKIVNFPQNSQLSSINKYAFSNSLIEKISIPSSLTQIEDFAFSSCKFLKNIEFPDDIKLATLGSNAFSYSSIRRIKIPSSVLKIENGAFYYCQQLFSIEFSEGTKLQSIGKDSFTGCEIETISIPSCVSKLGEFALSKCSRLKTINFSMDSELTSIENEALHGVGKGYVRGKLHFQAYIAEADGDNKTKLTFMGHADPCGSIPAMVYNAAATNQGYSLLNIKKGVEGH